MSGLFVRRGLTLAASIMLGLAAIAVRASQAPGGDAVRQIRQALLEVP